MRKAICVLELKLAKINLPWLILECKNCGLEHTPTKMAAIKKTSKWLWKEKKTQKTSNSMCWWRCGTIGTCMHHQQDCKLGQFWKAVLLHLRKAKLMPPLNPANAFLDTYHMACAGTCTAALIPIDKIWTPHTCHSTGEWIECGIQTGGCLLHSNGKDKLHSHVMTWMNLTGITTSEWSEATQRVDLDGSTYMKFKNSQN